MKGNKLEQYTLEKELMSRADLIMEKFDENNLASLKIFSKVTKFMVKFCMLYRQEKVAGEP